jgi:hypothetical protein
VTYAITVTFQDTDWANVLRALAMLSPTVAATIAVATPTVPLPPLVDPNATT